MAESRRMSKSELFTYFAERFDIRRAEAGEFFDELQQLTEHSAVMVRQGKACSAGIPRQVLSTASRTASRFRSCQPLSDPLGLGLDLDLLNKSGVSWGFRSIENGFDANRTSRRSGDSTTQRRTPLATSSPRCCHYLPKEYLR